MKQLAKKTNILLNKYYTQPTNIIELPPSTGNPPTHRGAFEDGQFSADISVLQLLENTQETAVHESAGIIDLKLKTHQKRASNFQQLTL